MKGIGVCFMLSQIIDLQQMIQERLQKIERLKHSLELQKVGSAFFRIQNLERNVFMAVH